MKMPSARLNRAAPSRRSSAGTSLTSWPILRTPPPTRWPIPSQAPPTTRRSQGSRCSTAGSRRVRGLAEEPVVRPVLDAAEPAPRPAAEPALPPEVPPELPLDADVVRVAILATVPEPGLISADFRAFRGLHVAAPATARRAGRKALAGKAWHGCLAGTQERPGSEEPGPWRSC